jgi:hypothetical protein
MPARDFAFSELGDRCGKLIYLFTEQRALLRTVADCAALFRGYLDADRRVG